ncbi:hypothetical protein MLD38_038370 [Melastoma candidum]|uniref:Uncharacterized protein n=1 Tax=Melastoma candidum TaxID=119954 RepID=A0ACB9KYQ2_9MYRT|nr:hypothetical protein MLD38_038370 [Melastoma candidum]
MIPSSPSRDGPKPSIFTRIDAYMAKSQVGRRFKLEERNTTFMTELRAGTTTFLTIAYIIAVNASILSDSGGTCTVHDCTPICSDFRIPVDECTEMNHQVILPGNSCKFRPVNQGYKDCLQQTHKDLVVATILSSLTGCLIMGMFANLPLALAPGMGTSAYFAYTVVGFHGSGKLSYESTLAAVFFEGLIFLLISALGVRGKLANLVPKPVRVSSSAGIGLFLAFIGLQNNQGIGLIGFSPSTLVTLGGCPSETKVALRPVRVGLNGTETPVQGTMVSGGIMCMNDRMESPVLWLGLVGFMLMAYFIVKNKKGAMIYGIIFVTVISWFRNTAVTAFPNTELGNSAYNYFKKIIDVHSIKNTAGALSFKDAKKFDFWVIVATFLYIDVLEATGTLFSMAKFAGMTDDNGTFEGQYFAFMADAASIVVGSLLGTSPLTTFVESATGIREGGRTGLTAITVSAYFFLSFFFTPLIASIPAWAVGPALILVGVLMMRSVLEIEWDDMRQAIPAFVTMILMPLTYSIAYGLIGGIGTYVFLYFGDWVEGLVRKIPFPRGVLCCPNKQRNGEDNGHDGVARDNRMAPEIQVATVERIMSL